MSKLSSEWQYVIFIEYCHSEFNVDMKSVNPYICSYDTKVAVLCVCVFFLFFYYFFFFFAPPASSLWVKITFMCTLK